MIPIFYSVVLGTVLSLPDIRPDRVLYYIGLILSWGSSVALVVTLLLLKCEPCRRIAGVTPAKLRRSIPLMIAVLFVAIVQQIGELRALTVKQFERHFVQPEPLTLDQVIGKLENEMAKPGSDRILIRHLGLDLTTAWEKVIDRLMKHLDTRPVRYELLILGVPAEFRDAQNNVIDIKSVPGYDQGIVNGTPTDVLDWAQAGEKSLREKIVPQLKAMANKRGRKFEWEVRQYSETPFPHGFSTTTDARGSFYYMTLCRWGEETHTSANYKKWDWAPDSYIELRAPSVDGDKIGYDLARVFDGFFAHLWTINAATAITGKSPE